MRPDQEPNPSWICRNEFERARFMDLHGRLVRANTAILLTLIVVIALALPFLPERLGLIPAAAGMALFGGIQRKATRFARPELWVFAALLGAEAMIVLAIAMNDGVLTPAMALLCWPVAGLAGRFPDRASRLGTIYAAMLAGATILVSDSEVLTRDPLALSLLLVAMASVHAMATVLRDSDVEHRGAAILDPLTGMLNRTALINRTVEIEHQSRLTGEPVAVIVADLDRFKLVNDNHGHATGDTVLQEVAYRLRKESCGPMTSPTGSAERSSWSCCSEAPTQRRSRRPSGSAQRSPLNPSSASTSPFRSAWPLQHPAPPSSGTTCSLEPTPRSTEPRRTAATA